MGAMSLMAASDLGDSSRRHFPTRANSFLNEARRGGFIFRF